MHRPGMPIYLSHDCYFKKQNLERGNNHQQLCLQKQPGILLYYAFSEDVYFKELNGFTLHREMMHLPETIVYNSKISVPGVNTFFQLTLSRGSQKDP